MSILNNTQVVDQTSAINKIPLKPGLIGTLGLYRAVPVSSDAVTFDVRENSFHVLDDHLRNVAQKNTTGDRPYNIHTLAIPHYPIERTIGREKLAGIRAFDKQSEQTVAAAVAEELELQGELHDLQAEYLTALMTIQGKIDTTHYGTIDAASEFGVTRPTQALSTTGITASIREAQRQAKAGLTSGGRINGYLALVGVDMFEALLNSEEMHEAFKGSSNDPLRLELGTTANGYQLFTWGNTTFIQYDDAFTKKDGTVIELLDSNKGVYIPRTQLGRIFYGPSSKLSGLGGNGQKRFASSFRDPKDRFIEVESEQNTLVIAEQFGATVNLTLA